MMSIELQLRRKYCRGELPLTGLPATRYWELVSRIKRQSVGSFVLCSLYVSPDEWYIEIQPA